MIFFIFVVYKIQNISFYLKTEIFCNIIVFPLTFDQLNPSLLNKSNTILPTPNFWSVVYIL